MIKIQIISCMSLFLCTDVMQYYTNLLHQYVTCVNNKFQEELPCVHLLVVSGSTVRCLLDLRKYEISAHYISSLLYLIS